MFKLLAGTIPTVMACVIIVSGSASGQTTVNPDISLIPRFKLETNDGTLLPAKREFSRPELSFEELECAIQAYLNPFSRADIVLTAEGPDVDNAKLGIEEAYATVVRGLPLDLNVRFGKYRAEFGKINTQHPHAWPFVTPPLVMSRFLGDAVNDLGISASALLPTGDIYTRVNIDLLRGKYVAGTVGMPDPTVSSPYYSVAGRLMGFFQVSDNSDLETGASMLTGIHDPIARLRFWYWNYDFKYKYKPSSYTSLVVQGEFLFNNRSVNVAYTTPGIPIPRYRRDVVNSAGSYLYADYQFGKIYSIGGRLDWSQSPYSTSDWANGIAVFAGYYPVEETLGLRLQYQYTTETVAGMRERPVNTISLQALFSLGPHKAHPF